MYLFHLEASQRIHIPTEAPAPELVITDGMMLYYEDFSKYGDVDSLDATMAALGWKIQTMDDDYAYSDWTSGLAIVNGQLVVTNYDSAAGFKGSDSYALMLGEDYMTDRKEHATCNCLAGGNKIFESANTYKAAHILL